MAFELPWHLVFDGSWRQVGAVTTWAHDSRGRLRPNPGPSPAAMLRQLWKYLRNDVPDVADLEQIQRAFGVRVPSRSPLPGLVAELTAGGATQAEAVRKIAESEQTSEGVVRTAMSRAAGDPPVRRAERIWEHDGADWVLVYDVEHDARYTPRDQ